MSNYRILQKRLQIEKSPAMDRRGVFYAGRKVTRKQELWTGETLPGPEDVAYAIIKKVIQAETGFDPQNRDAWRRQPTILDEKILIQEQRTPKLLGWKTLQLSDIGPPNYEPLEVQVVEESQRSNDGDSEAPGRFKRIMAFAMANDPVFNAARQ